MRVQTAQLAGDQVRIFFPSAEEADSFYAWLERTPEEIACDTETTGLNVYHPRFRVHQVQFGTAHEAWVLDGRRPELMEAARKALMAKRLIFHNAPFDLRVISTHLHIPMPLLWPRVRDTFILAHLIDPRPKPQGPGLALKDQASVWIDASAPDSGEALHNHFRRGLRCKIADGWWRIEPDDPILTLYGGLDTILAYRLATELSPIVSHRGWSHLESFELELSRVLAQVQQNGILLDQDYASSLSLDLTDEEREAAQVARRYGVRNVNSTQQVAEALEALGAELTERTETGAPKVDRHVLEALDLPLADAILAAKRAQKFRVSYVDASLGLVDSDGLVHPNINPLKARTGRMSVDTPPLQQLPSQDWRIRRMFLARPGLAIVSADYRQLEMCVLAVLAEEPTMMEAVRSGESLHKVTARNLFGEGYDERQYKLAKNTGFGEVFGGGEETLARQADVSIEVAREAKAMYGNRFPGIRKFSQRLIDDAKFGGDRSVITPSGRRLPLDGNRLYSATNYIVQSTARDVLGQALLDLDREGFTDHILMPIHDEVLAEASTADAEEFAHELGRIMTHSDFLGSGVDLLTDPEVYGPSWGHGYGATQ